MRLYAEGAGDHVTVEGVLHAWIDTDLNVQIDDADQWIAFGKIAAQAGAGGTLQGLGVNRWSALAAR